MRLGGLIHFDEAPQLSVCVLPIEKSQVQTKHKNQFSQTEAVRKKNVVKLKVCLVRSSGDNLFKSRFRAITIN